MNLGKRRSLTALFLLLTLALAAVPWPAAAETKPLTPPPPVEMRPMTTYTGYEYLLSSSRRISDNGDRTVSLAATTQAKTAVDELGAIVQPQKWNGTAWIDYGSAVALSVRNSSLYQGATSWAAASGYYFRAKVTHYAKKGALSEQVTEYTDSLLVQ